MIEFDWRENYKHEYHINWDIQKDPYQILYLHYRNVSPILKINSNKEISFVDKEVSGVIPIRPRSGYHFESVPQLDYAMYIFELKETTDVNEVCLPGKKKELCIAPRIVVIKEEIAYEGDYSRLQIKSKYKIPGVLMDLYIEILPGERFSMPEMKCDSDSFYKTGCLIKSGKSKNIKIKYDEKIARFIETTEVSK